MKQSQLILIGVIALVILGGGYFLLSGNQSAMDGTKTSEEVQPTNAMMAETTPAEGSSGTMMETSASEKMGAKTFTVSGNNFAFDVKEMKVKKGDTVTVIFKNAEGFHDWVLDEFNAKTKQIQAGAEETITFVADKVGTFEYYCSVGQHRANGMVGNLIVEE